MLKASVPQDYVKFVKQFNDELYELLTVNENRVGWILYSEVKENDLYAIIDSACKVSVSSIIRYHPLTLSLTTAADSLVQVVAKRRRRKYLRA